jgi:hypothetical protein
MFRRLSTSALLVCAVVAALVAASGCSSSSKSSSSNSTTPTRATFTAQAPTEIVTPPAKGKVNEPQPSPALPKGYVEQELFVGGTATRFTGDTSSEDGKWTATPAGEAKYRTRVIVKRPTDPKKFSGNVILEWFNVSALESNPDWAFLSNEIGREGDAYIGVSAQKQGVEGGKTLLNANVSSEQAKSLGATADKSGLKNIDPARYGTLTHPGDAYALDIFSQVARAARTEPDKMLGGLQPKKVLGFGESQSAAFMTTLANAIQPLSPTFDGFFIHSRGSQGIPLNGEIALDGSGISKGVSHIRDDLDVPVFMFETETDLTALGYSKARQPDTDKVHTWEVAGTSHADSFFVQSILGGPRDPSVGSFIGCKAPVNTGPQHEVIEAALHQFRTWVDGGAAPPTSPQLEVVAGDPVATLKRDKDGMALGGIRNPLTDVPVAIVSGEPPKGALENLVKTGDICGLFGSTKQLDKAALIARYGSFDNYLKEFRASAAKAVAAGFLLQPEANSLIAEAQTHRALFG